MSKRIRPGATERGSGDRSKVIDRDLSRYYSLVDTTVPSVLEQFSIEELLAMASAVNNNIDVTATRTASVRTVRMMIQGIVADGILEDYIGQKIDQLDDVEFIALVDTLEVATFNKSKLLVR